MSHALFSVVRMRLSNDLATGVSAHKSSLVSKIKLSWHNSMALKAKPVLRRKMATFTPILIASSSSVFFIWP